jgi:hypothetical protein
MTPGTFVGWALVIRVVRFGKVRNWRQRGERR